MFMVLISIVIVTRTLLLQVHVWFYGSYKLHHVIYIYSYIYWSRHHKLTRGHKATCNWGRTTLYILELKQTMYGNLTEPSKIAQHGSIWWFSFCSTNMVRWEMKL